jgi:hypothetical protein
VEIASTDSDRFYLKQHLVRFNGGLRDFPEFDAMGVGGVIDDGKIRAGIGHGLGWNLSRGEVQCNPLVPHVEPSLFNTWKKRRRNGEGDLPLPASHVEDCLRELEKAGKGVVAVNDRIECGRGKERTSRQ